MFDSHCHLHDARMAAVREGAIERAAAAGVRSVLLAGVDEPGWRDEDELARQPLPLRVLIAYGLHPQMVPLLDDSEVRRQLDALGRALRGEPLADGTTLARAHALGETGLDALTDKTKACLPRQESVFREQLAMARALDLPVMLHLLRAHEPALRLLKRDGLPRAGGVVHSFSGSAELCGEYVKLGLHISFAGSVTYPNARRLHAAAAVVPAGLLLVETDAPDQTPDPRKPLLNEPAFLVDVIETVARLRGETVGRIAELTDENAHRLLGLVPPREGRSNERNGTPS